MTDISYQCFMLCGCSLYKEDAAHWIRVAAFPYAAAIETEVGGLQQRRTTITPQRRLFGFLCLIQSLVCCIVMRMKCVVWWMYVILCCTR